MESVTGPIWHHLSDAADAPSGQYFGFAQIPLLDRLSDPKRVLDVGCAAGGLGRALKERFPGCIVTGIELNRDAAREAEKFLDRVIVADVASIDWQKVGADYDAIVFADVLEHLYNPWKTLNEVRPLLAPDGAVLASIPNVRNLTLINNLVGFGDWKYTTAGLLDITHVRFFSRNGARSLFEDSGYRVTDSRAVIDPVLADALAAYPRSGGKQTIRVGRLQIDSVGYDEMTDLCAWQFLIRATPQAD
jgi:SAM-dependent methyltransferase